jgi:hypothetical protein
MHCPGCGNESALDQKFCRKCGFDLAPVTKLMVGDIDANELELDKTPRDKLILQRMVRWMMWGMLALLIGIVFAVVGKQFALDHVVKLVGLFFMLGGLSLTTYGVLDALRRGAGQSANAKVRPADNSAELDKAPTTKQLESRLPVPVPSVTERTTELIGGEDAGANSRR